MRVLNILFDERMGGPQVRLASVAERLRTHGVETIAVMPRGESEFASVLNGRGIPFRQIRMRRLRASRAPSMQADWVASFGPTVAELTRIIRDCGIDIVHTNSMMNVQAAVAAKLTRTPLVWHLNDINTPRALVWALRPAVRAWPDVIAVASQAVADYCWPRTKQPQVFLQYPPVDVEQFSSCAEERPAAATPIAQKVITTLGNLNPSKGQDYLIQAFASVSKRYPDAHLVIAGTPLGTRQDYSRDLRKLTAQLGLAERVSFLGTCNDVPALMAGTTVYVHPSLAEACSMAVLEAMAAGRPIVATAVGGVPELIQNDVSGLLAPSRDSQALRNAIVRMFDDVQLRQRCAAAAREAAWSFDLTACVERHVEMYNLALENHARSHAATRYR